MQRQSEGENTYSIYCLNVTMCRLSALVCHVPLAKLSQYFLVGVMVLAARSDFMRFVQALKDILYSRPGHIATCYPS